ncbi:MAG TPA: hypothetical protein VFS90_05665 [Pyrinomonadaceae bacterium]|nr:hypothetical protein [Pyrinomonadaceae bacterium]
MFRQKRTLFGFAALALIFGAIALVTPRLTSGQKPDVPGGQHKPLQNVNVVNTPLPVTGTVAIESSSDSPLLVRDVDTSSRQPFHKFIPISPFEVPPPIHVPVGKRLVFEYASLDAAIELNCRIAFIRIATVVGGTLATHHVPISSHTIVGSRNSEVTGQQIKLYADPGTDASVLIAVSGDNCNPIGAMAVSGYFENVPQP